jgi:hypothetical protein
MKHNLIMIEGAYPLECTVCGLSWKKEPVSSCPGVKVYAWGKWGELLTKAQMNEAGFNTGAKLPPPAGAVFRDKSPGGIMWLYDRGQGVPKKEVSEAQRAALTKAQERARLVPVHCSVCHLFLEEVTAKKAETLPEQLCDQCSDSSEAVHQSQQWLENGCLILDTETTGLYDAEIVQLAIINHHGETLLNTLVKPEHPEKMMQKSSSGVCAYDIHGIHPDSLVDAPTIGDLYPELYKILRGQSLVIYNKAYDYPILKSALQVYHCPKIPLKAVNCAMELYAQWFGDWSSYYKSYKWQPLPGGDHTALGDCLATLQVIKTMASDNGKASGDE